jgi:hypothetical protein
VIGMRFCLITLKLARFRGELLIGHHAA